MKRASSAIMGMTRAEVAEVFGRPPDFKTGGGSIGHFIETGSGWFVGEGGGRICVVFDRNSGKALERSYLPPMHDPNFLDRLRTWLGW